MKPVETINSSDGRLISTLTKTKAKGNCVSKVFNQLGSHDNHGYRCLVFALRFCSFEK